MTGRSLKTEFVFACNMRIQLFHQFVCIDAVYLAGLLNGLASCGRASEAVHPHIEEERSSGRVSIQYVADDRGFFDGHGHSPFHIPVS